MQMLRLSISLPDDARPGMTLWLSANDADCGVVIALPKAGGATQARRQPLRDTGAPDTAAADYVLGGYAGI